MPMGGLIMAEVPASGWRTPTSCNHKVMGLPSCLGGGGRGGRGGRGGPGSGGGRGSGAGGGNGRWGSKGRHRGKGDTPRAERGYRGKHRSKKTREKDARKDARKRAPASTPRSRQVEPQRNDPPDSPGSEAILDKYDVQFSDDPRSAGEGRSAGPRKPMPDQQFPGREMQPD